MIRVIYFFALVFCCYAVSSCSENSTNTEIETPDETAVSDITAMSFNVRYSGGDTDEHKWDNRKGACLAMINALKPSVIGMQEVRPDQKKIFDDNLKDYIIVGVGRDGTSNTEYVSIGFRTDILTLKSKGTFWLSETPDLMSKGWDGAAFRICTWARLQVKGTKKEIYFFNTHIDHKGTDARKQGLLLIKERIKEIAGDENLVILTGDFNMTPDNANIIDFTTFMNSLREQFVTGSDYNAPTYNNWGMNAAIIDYIWYVNTTPTAYKVLNEAYKGVTYLSDHSPILGKFELPQ
ncbi:MAG: endonuclease/exonuclease/phosphatase family protein [Draconibacterium sp.]